MVSLREQESLFKLIGKNLKEKIECFIIGGSAMLYYGAKDATKDIDLVFLNEKDRNKVLKVLFDLDYTKQDTRLLYFKKKRVPILLHRGDIKIDLFDKKIICFELSNAIIDRVKYIYEFENLIVKVVAPEDIILLKCATERAGDRADAAELIKKFNINWEIIVEESKNQIKAGEMIAPAFLYEFLFELKEDFKADIPKEVLTKLRKLAEKEMIKALKKGSHIKEEKL